MMSQMGDQCVTTAENMPLESEVIFKPDQCRELYMRKRQKVLVISLLEKLYIWSQS